MRIVDIITEGLTPLELFPTKRELAMKTGLPVIWKGKLVGWTTGEMQDQDTIIIKPNPEVLKYAGIENCYAKLPIDKVSIG